MRLPNGFGSVYKLSGHRRNPWAARRTIGFKDNGQPIYKFVGYYSNRKDAMTALADYNADPYDLTSYTFKELYEKWSEDFFKDISESNRKGYRAAYKLCSKIENVRFTDIKIPQYQMVVDESGKNTPTLKKLKVLLSNMMKYAVRQELITPERGEMIRFLDISKAGNPNKRDRNRFTQDEIKALWGLKSNEYVTIILMLIYTGVRIGEFLDLRAEDVHLEERWFFVRESKTESGIREVPIAEKIVPFFEHWLSKGTETLLSTPEGKPFLYRNYKDSYWKPFAGEHMPHDTRHTCISLLTEAEVDDRIIKQIVGHKGQTVTENVYTHVDLPHKLEAINKI